MSFYKTKEWLQLRYKALAKNGNTCQACGRSPKDKIIIHVDHIKPKSIFPELALSLENLQVLCEDCNLGKSNTNMEDWSNYSGQILSTKRLEKKEKQKNKKSSKEERRKRKFCVHNNYRQFYEKVFFSNGTPHIKGTCTNCNYVRHITRKLGENLLLVQNMNEQQTTEKELIK